LQCPLENTGLIRLTIDDDDRRQAVKQQSRFFAKPKAPTDEKKTFTIPEPCNPILRIAINLLGLDSLNPQIAGQHEGAPLG